MKIKRERKKKKRQLRLILFCILIILIIGMLGVDLALREMLALEDTKVLGFDIGDEYLTLYGLGHKIYIENSKIDKIHLYLRRVYLDIKRNGKNIIGKIITSRRNRLFQM